MPDREKVIRSFEQYVYNFVELTTTDEYNHQILEQVLVLLKEQEAMKECLKKKCVICPHCANCDVDDNGLLKEQEAKQVNISQTHCGMKYGLCPRCEKQIDTLVNPHYCGNCGQELKWE